MDEKVWAPSEPHPDPRGRAEIVDHTSEISDRLGAGAPVDVVDRDRLVEQHLALVHRLCRRFRGLGEPLEDLAQVGTIGLIKAINKFDPTRGISLTTYAVPVILGEVKNYLRDHGWAVKVPRKLQSQKLAVQRAVEVLGQTLSRTPTVQEITHATGFSQEEVFDTLEVVNYTRPLSLDAEYQGDGERGPPALSTRLEARTPSSAI